MAAPIAKIFATAAPHRLTEVAQNYSLNFKLCSKVMMVYDIAVDLDDLIRIPGIFSPNNLVGKSSRTKNIQIS
jgi:hypothetical protein